MMLSKFLGILTSDIEVEVQPALFRFRRKDRELTLKTVVFIATEGAPRVLGVGEAPMLTEPFVQVNLFDPELPVSNFVGRTECLGLFFQHAFKALTGRYEMIRPLVRFRNADSLKNILCGYEKGILGQAAQMGGARDRVFLD